MNLDKLPIECRGCGAAIHVPWEVELPAATPCPRCGERILAERGILMAGKPPEPLRRRGEEVWDLGAFEKGYRGLADYRDNLEYARCSGVPEVAERYRYPLVKGWVVREFGSVPGRAFLDVGTGAGFMLYQLREAYPDRAFRFVATDVAIEHLRIAAARAAEDRPRFIMPVAAEGERLVFAAASFDGVTCSEVLEHVFDKPRAMAEIARVLKPGGVLLLTTPRRSVTAFWNLVFALPRRVYRLFAGKGWRLTDDPPPYDEPVSPRALRRLAEQAGLEVEKMDCAVCLIHESYLKFLPGMLVRAWVGLARLGGRFGLARLLGLHIRLRARKPQGGTA